MYLKGLLKGKPFCWKIAWCFYDVQTISILEATEISCSKFIRNSDNYKNEELLNSLKSMHSGVMYFGKIPQIQFQIPSENSMQIIRYLFFMLTGILCSDMYNCTAKEFLFF